MTTQNISAVVGNGMFTRTFSDTATDGQWTGNILTDDVAETNLGLVMPGQTIDHVQLEYTGGACLWRIQSSQSLLVKRYGYGTLDGYSCWESSRIPAYTVAPDDILVVYPLPQASAAGEGNVLAWVNTTRGFEAFGVEDVASGAATVMKTLVNNQTLGDYAFNANLRSITVQLEDEAQVVKVEVIDQVGGIIWTGFGNARLPSDGGTSLYYNFMADGLNIPILKGYTLKITIVAP